jgi:hypothetical protein
MYNLHLKYKGILVTLTNPTWVLNNELIHLSFRKWLEGKEYYMQMLPDNSFMEKEKTVLTAILKIFKK